MSTVGAIVIACLAFLFGAICGIIMISMCWSNEKTEDDEASYELGFEKGYEKGKQIMVADHEQLCQHCAYKR